MELLIAIDVNVTLIKSNFDSFNMRIHDTFNTTNLSQEYNYERWIGNEVLHE